MTRALRESDLSEDAHDFLLGRGALASVLARWGVKTFDVPVEPCPDPEWRKRFGPHGEFFENKIVFPLYDLGGIFLGFDVRSVGKKDPLRVMFPDKPWSAVWIGMPEAMSSVCQHPGQWVAWVVEGVFDAFALHHAIQHPQHVVLGAGPAHLNHRHIEFLARWSPYAVHICFDQDAAGRRGTARALLDLGKRGVRCQAVPYGRDGDDPGSIWDRGGAAAIREAFSHFVI